VRGNNGSLWACSAQQIRRVGGTLSGLLSRQIYSNYTAILPYTYRRESLRVEDGGRREERSEVMYCIGGDTYLYIIDVRTDHAVFMCGAVRHTSVYLLMGC